MRVINFATISLFIFFTQIFYTDNLRSEFKKNSIIKIFCKESVKSEFKNNSLRYEESIGENVCNCYLENISKNISHENSISKCKLKIIKKN